MNHTSDSGATGPSEEAMRLIAAGLTDIGLTPRLIDDPDDRYLTIPWMHGKCLLAITDWGHVEWEYHPRNSAVPDPQWLASHAVALLSGSAAAPGGPDNASSRESLPHRARVGLELKARGFDVALDVITDMEYLEVYAEIVATVPGSAKTAEVRIADDGTVTWTRNYWADSATDWAALAEEIMTTLIRALRVSSGGPAAVRSSSQ